MKSVPRTIILVLFLFEALLLLSACRATPAPSAPPPTPTWTPVPVALPQATQVVLPQATQAADDIPRIAVDELWQRLQAGEAIVVVDARGADDYQLQHIAGAINMPSAEVTQRAGELPKDKLLVFYCT